MARCPFATWRPVPNFGGPMAGYLGLVIHVTAGEGDPYNEFANPANQVSSHFGIGNGQGGMADGLIEQYVDTANESWAQVGGNSTYISVETEGLPSDPLTPAQVASFARLYQWAHNNHGIPYVITDTPGDRGFITHGDGGAAWGNHIDCPGPLRSPQRQDILNLAQPGPQGDDQVAVTETFKWNGSFRVLQASVGTLWHKWCPPDGNGNPDWSKQNNQNVLALVGLNVTLTTAKPEWAVLPTGRLTVNVEATDSSVYELFQDPGGPWGITHIA